MSTPAPRLSRRALLRGLGAAVVLGAMPGCASSRDGTDAAGATSAGADARAALRAAGVEGSPDLEVLLASYEVLTGPSRVQFALRRGDDTVRDLDAEVTLVAVRDGTVAAGPLETRWFDTGLEDQGIYVAPTRIAAPGLYHLVVTSADGTHAGSTEVRVIAPDDSAVAPVGAAFPPLHTPTDAEPDGLAQLCTRDPACGMHAVSVEGAMDAGTPVVLTVASPAHCANPSCASVVEVVRAAATSGEHPDVAFVHVEVFADEGQTRTAVVEQLRLPTAPWTFLIDRDGRLADRFDGPVVPDLLRAAIARL